MAISIPDPGTSVTVLAWRIFGIRPSFKGTPAARASSRGTHGGQGYLERGAGKGEGPGKQGVEIQLIVIRRCRTGSRIFREVAWTGENFLFSVT